MCGIAGVLQDIDREQVAEAIGRHLGHRGPDEAGIHDELGCRLIVRRLAVRGGMRRGVPIRLPDRVMAFNGEIYRAPPEGAGAPGAVPETPVEEMRALLSAEARGLEPDGMYAIAELRPGDRSLVLRRDRFGIKPLFFRIHGGRRAFASETRALRLGTGHDGGVSEASVDDVLAFGRVLGANTLFPTIFNLEPGARLSLALGEGPSPPEIGLTAARAEAGVTGDLRGALRASLEACAFTDRPLGLALSGGVDSSILAFELNELGVERLTTLSVHVAGRDDGVRDLASLGLSPGGAWTRWRHVNVQVSPESFPELLAESVHALDGPHAMSSAPLYIALARAAAEAGVIVLLTGEGPDELFYGYDSHRAFVEAALRAHAGPEGARLSGLLEAFALPEARRAWLHDLLPRARVIAAEERFRRSYGELSRLGPLEALRELELRLSLEPLLVRADHCLMRHGIEGRTPFLHGGVPELAAAASSLEELHERGPKWPLRAAFRGVLPAHLLDRPKTPFRAPLTAWLAQRSAGFVEELLASGEGRLGALGVRVPGRDTRERMAGAEGGASLLFTLCTLALWLEQQRHGPSGFGSS